MISEKDLESGLLPMETLMKGNGGRTKKKEKAFTNLGQEIHLKVNPTVTCASNVVTFEGTWKDGKREGPGKFTFPNGAYYEGKQV